MIAGGTVLARGPPVAVDSKSEFQTEVSIPLPYSSHPYIWPTPAEFSSNPNQTHLSMLISVFMIIRKSQVGEFDQGWS